MTKLCLAIRCLLMFLAFADVSGSKVEWKRSSEASNTKVRRGSRKLASRKKKKSKGKQKGESVTNTGSYDSADNIFNHGSSVTIDTEDGFINYCQEQLLSFSVASDGLVSQADAAAHIRDVCDIMDDEDLPAFNCPTPQFANLEIEVQLSFVWFICPRDDQMSLLQCLANLGVQDNDFGYSVTGDAYHQAQENVLGFCCSLLPFVERTRIDPLVDSSVCPSNLPIVRLETPAPTSKPMPAPAVSRVSQPTASPVATQVDFFSTPSPTRTPALSSTGGAPLLTVTNTIPRAEAIPVFRSSGAVEPNTLSPGATVGIVLGGASIFLIFGFLASNRRQGKPDPLS